MSVRILSRIDDKLKKKLEKILLSYKYSKNSKSDIIRLAMQKTINDDFLKYVNNNRFVWQTIANITYNLNGLIANFSQILEFNFKRKIYHENINKSIIFLKDRNTNFIKKDLKILLKNLKLFPNEFIKNNLIICRIDLEEKKEIEIYFSKFPKLKLNMSKFIRLSLLYFFNKKKMIFDKDTKDIFFKILNLIEPVEEITFNINKIAYDLNRGMDISDNFLVDSILKVDMLLDKLINLIKELVSNTNSLIKF